MEIADANLAAGKVSEFLVLLSGSQHHWQEAGRAIPDHDPEWIGREGQIRKQLPLIERIAERMDPALAQRMRGESHGWPWQRTLEAAQELAGILASLQEAQKILGPVGPKLSAANLHPWVWNAAVDLWDDGHRREAIQAAASAIFDHHLPAKLGIPRPQSTKDLAAQVFSTTAPAAGKPRLRLPDFTTGTPDWTSQHEGAMYLGMACAQLIRNLTTHGAEPDEQTALEQLATLSLYARLADLAQLAT